jgi:hypothetical protein
MALTLNKQVPPKIRLRKAKAWLIENPQEKQSTAARIFKINTRTLNNSNRRVINPSHGGQNRILSDAQEHALHAFIRDWLALPWSEALGDGLSRSPQIAMIIPHPEIVSDNVLNESFHLLPCDIKPHCHEAYTSQRKALLYGPIRRF